MAEPKCQLDHSARQDPYAQRGRELSMRMFSELLYGAGGLNPDPYLEALRSGAPVTERIRWE